MGKTKVKVRIKIGKKAVAIPHHRAKVIYHPVAVDLSPIEVEHSPVEESPTPPPEPPLQYDEQVRKRGFWERLFGTDSD